MPSAGGPSTSRTRAAPSNWSVGVAASASRLAPAAASRSSAPTATATRGSRAPSRYRAPPAGERSVSRAAGIRLASAGGVGATQGTPAGPRIAHSGSQRAGFARNRPESGVSGRVRAFRACYGSMRIRPIWREKPERASSAAWRSGARLDRIRAMAGERRPVDGQLGILPCVPHLQPSTSPAPALAAAPLSR